MPSSLCTSKVVPCTGVFQEQFELLYCLDFVVSSHGSSEKRNRRPLDHRSVLILEDRKVYLIKTREWACLYTCRNVVLTG